MNSSVELPKIDCQPRMRRSTYIANHLRDMIFDGSLKPGDRLPTEEQLCKHFGVSRTTLRESVQMLRVSGLLDVTPGRGSFICMPNATSIMKDLMLIGKYNSDNNNDVASLRSLIEIDMVRKACDASLDERKDIHNYVIRRQANAEEVEEMERSWHMKIASLSASPIISIIVESLISMQRSSRIQTFSSPEEVMHTMSMQLRINSAILDGDKNSAMRLMSGYLGTPTQNLNELNTYNEKINMPQEKQATNKAFAEKVMSIS